MTLGLNLICGRGVGVCGRSESNCRSAMLRLEAASGANRLVSPAVLSHSFWPRSRSRAGVTVPADGCSKRLRLIGRVTSNGESLGFSQDVVRR